MLPDSILEVSTAFGFKGGGCVLFIVHLDKKVPEDTSGQVAGSSACWVLLVKGSRFRLILLAICMGSGPHKCGGLQSRGGPGHGAAQVARALAT